MSIETAIQRNVPLAPLCTLELGGAARYFVEAQRESEVGEALAWAREREVPVMVLGGGSNVLVADAGFDGLVVRVAMRGVECRREGDAVHVTVAAGEPWDPLVERTVAEGWAGLECLSGIPGTVGATPIQNVGAYGQDVAETIVAVRVLDRRTGATATLRNADCRFAYRDSAFKHPGSDAAHAVVLSVTFALRPGGAAAVRYPELSRALAISPGGAAASLSQVRATVLALRRSKSMVLDPADDNRRSAGSFFTNPLVAPAQAEEVVRRALAAGLVADAAEVPRFDGGEGRVKLAAAWLIERAGFRKGERHGRVGISSRHALALVHHGGGSSAELLALARRIQAEVRARFDVELTPEPVLVGF